MRLTRYLNEMTMKSKDVNIEKAKSSSKKYSQIINIENTKFTFRAVLETVGDLAYDFKYEYPFLTKYAPDDEHAWYVDFIDEEGGIKQVQRGKDIALKLFAALTKVIEDFIKSKKPDAFLFSADESEQSRVKLYNLIAKKITRFGYVNVENAKQSGVIAYLFVKKG